ncbi:lysozyme inhibitor LprI family protein [Roseinatronobacter ekhonensis]|uniref:lysozyme inhibitor LprI family protein n=1 Tax=Roseinatronobacter ekhonensis TaxID=254356 RepID=UPI0024826BEF|nr:lysozyme inhibitor LprI family protein [Roseibaca ekhonensis]
MSDMQRAWIVDRNARCGHEASLWQDGTGSGRDFANCLLQETAKQALFCGALYSGEG